MLLSKSLGVNKEGNLTVGGADCVALAKSFGTPLYVFDEGLIAENMRAYKETVEGYEGGGLVCYASKAFSCKEMARIAAREGLGLDVVSGGELYTARSADFPLSKYARADCDIAAVLNNSSLIGKLLQKRGAKLKDGAQIDDTALYANASNGTLKIFTRIDLRILGCYLELFSREKKNDGE